MHFEQSVHGSAQYLNSTKFNGRLGQSERFQTILRRPNSKPRASRGLEIMKTSDFAEGSKNARAHEILAREYTRYIYIIT